MKARTSMNGLLLIFFIVQASEWLQVPLSSVYPLGYYILFTFMISWNRSSNSHHLPLTVFVGDSNSYTLVFTLLVSQSDRVSRQADTLPSSLVHLWYPVSAEGKQGHHVERQCKETASLLTCLHCFRSGIMCCSGLFRWKRLMKKGPVLPKNTEGKTEGQREKRHQLSTNT